MSNKERLQHWIDRLDFVKQRIEEGDLIIAFEIMEGISTQIETEKTKEGATSLFKQEKTAFEYLMKQHASIKRKLLKEMAKNL